MLLDGFFGSEHPQSWARFLLSQTCCRRCAMTRYLRVYTPRVVSDHIMMQDDFVRLYRFLLETEDIPEISDDLRNVVEEEWPELAHKLPSKAD
jgi:hypothetical protein